MRYAKRGFQSFIGLVVLKIYCAKSLKTGLEAVIAFILGFIASYAFSLPTGASIVAVHTVFFVLAMAGKAVRTRLMTIQTKNSVYYLSLDFE